MKVLVIGANGKIGTQLIDKLKSNAHNPIAMVRSKEQLEKFAEEKEVEAVVADLEEDFDHAYDDVDAVIFTAGSGSGTGKDKTHLVDNLGAKKAVDYAVSQNVDRFIMVSAFGADSSPDQWPDSMKHYYEAKADADKHLMQSPLNYTILRPGKLTDEEGNGFVQFAEKTKDRKGEITRTDVASVIVKILDKENTFKRSFELLKGDKPIDEAVKSLS